MKYTKIRFLGLNLLAIFALTNCIDDKGNYDYLPKEEVLPGSISGLEEHYDVLFGETVHLEAKVEGAENKENIRYMWYLYAYPNERTRDTLGYGLSLDWHVEQSTGTYYLWFEARDTITDVCVNKRADITIGTPLSDAWLIVETTDGMTDLDAITSEGELMEDLVTSSTGERLQGNGVKVVYCQRHAHEVENADGTVEVENYKVFYLLSENEVQIFNAENMELLKRTEDCFYEMPETVHPENCYVANRDVCLINAGQYYYFSGMSANVGKFPNAVFGLEGAEYSLHHEAVQASQQFLLWDKLSQSFLWASLSSALYAFDDAPEDGGGYGSPAEMNANLLHLLYRSSVYNWDTYSATYNAYAIMQENSGDYRLADLAFAGNATYPLKAYDKLPEDCQLLSADIIIAHQTAGAMYFAVGDQVWMHEVSSRQTAAEREYQVADFNGEEITYLRHVNRTQSDLDHLIVFTYDGENWKMYALPFIGGGAEIDASGNLDNYLVGTGKGRVNYCTRLIGNYEY